MEKYLFDYHTQVLEHGENKPLRVEETIVAAINCGLSSICLTDHFPLPVDFVDPSPTKDCCMSSNLYVLYQSQVDQIITKYKKRIQIYRGAECDWLPKYGEWTKKQLRNWPFDYIIGSVHFLGEIDDKAGRRNFILDYGEKEFLNGVAFYGGIRQLTEEYFSQVRTMISSRLFNGVGHTDLVKKYNDGSLFTGNEGWYRNQVSQTLDVLADSSMVMEINTAGWDKKCKEQYPSFWIIQEAYKRDIPLTIGSDAHVPDKIGRNLDKAISLAKKAGYTKLIKFIKRKKVEVEI